MRSLILTALVSAALALALPAFATDDLLAPLVGPDDPLAPLTSEPTKPKPKPGKPKPAKPAPGKPKPKPPVVEPSDEPEVDKPPVTKKVNAERITVRGVPPMALKSGQSATLTFRILDGAGKPIAAELLLLTNVGTITAAVEVNPGVFTATYAAPASGHDTSAVVHAEVKNAARPTSFDTKIMLVLTPPETQPIIATEPKHAPRPARVAFGDRLQATAGKTSTVRFQIEDEDGNPIVPADLKLRADSGRFENVREEGGSFVADYIAEDGAGEVTVMA
ncbi:MAG: hypothetical protein HY901_14890 [Deltaproteobacteria bacterium]|nr:hypothetical protein [Deltaproteobacteria bacterium]